MIPQIIMQTWKTTRLPKKWQKSPLSLQKLNPKWKYYLMTDKDNRIFVQKHFPKYLHMYDCMSYNIQRADIIRYMWLYIHGGVYIDLDYLALQPFDSIFRNRRYHADLFFINSTNYDSYITNSFMASMPKCSFWLELLNEIYTRFQQGSLLWTSTKHIEVMMISGPQVLDYVAKNVTRIPYIILPKQLINPYSTIEATKDLHKTTTNHVLYPLEGQSWTNTDSQIINFVGRYKIWIGIVLVLALFLWGYYRNARGVAALKLNPG